MSARVTPRARVVDGQLVRWPSRTAPHDRAKVEAGRAALLRALALAAGGRAVRGPGRDRLAPGEEEVDWDEVAALYERLERMTGSPCGLNRAAAVAEAGAPERALELVDSLELGDYDICIHSAELLRASGARTRRGRRSSTPCGWPRRTRSAGSSPAGWRGCDQA